MLNGNLLGSDLLSFRPDLHIMRNNHALMLVKQLFFSLDHKLTVLLGCLLDR